ncbi:hypothetical protein BEWA_014010 [Theileria equi strain WA]|uniref:Uncharacterized protein n=1 Tax=Theileria equi strain WA TaxID=1537102 RepID=L1LBP2_THEEQ|nr:hypothetical protein BEWA_014010 [Theileria equi strain WA]EKX72842.1 hypothetical protein BEWA_014010 [Theileria equi strain WA]|eukprot:XP_004832294.1 hypothetical protein BEWA_014010 [Theileria equi strain WA]
MSKTCQRRWASYDLTTVDIGKGPGSDDVTTDNGKYTYKACAEIIIDLSTSKYPTGYTKYTHAPRRVGTGSINPYIGGINHHGTEQRGFGDLDDWNSSLDVYYLDYDTSRVLPLVIKITRYGYTIYTYTYFNRKEYLAVSDWKRDTTIGNDGDSLTAKLKEISGSLSDLMVLKIDQVKNGNYYSNGEDKPPEANRDTQVQVTQSTYETVYNKLTHKLPGKKLRVLSTKSGSTNTPFDLPNVHITPYSEAHVYFWTGDANHEKPLLISLSSETSSKHYKYGSGKWKLESGEINDGNLKQNLDQENCDRNDAHIVNISYDGGSGYNCPSCGSKWVLVSRYGTRYSYSHHNLAGSSIRRFKDRDKDQVGLPSLKGTSQVYVYQYPKASGTPLLIYLPYSPNKWYQRISKTGNEWEKVQGDPPSSPGDPNIFKLLKTINGDKEGLSDGAIAGISGGVLGGGGVIGLGIWKGHALFSLLKTLF